MIFLSWCPDRHPSVIGCGSTPGSEDGPVPMVGTPDQRGVLRSNMSVYRDNTIIDGIMIDTWGGASTKHALQI